MGGPPFAQTRSGLGSLTQHFVHLVFEVQLLLFQVFDLFMRGMLNMGFEVFDLLVQTVVFVKHFGEMMV